MLLKNHLIEVFQKASSENNILLKENIVLKWVHRFGIDSLNDSNELELNCILLDLKILIFFTLIQYYYL